MRSVLEVLIPSLLVLLCLGVSLIPDARFTVRFPFVTSRVLPDDHRPSRVGWAKAVTIALALVLGAVLLCLLIV
jgi:hypothetical protein